MTAAPSISSTPGFPVHVCERHGLEHLTPDGGRACTGHSKRPGHKCCTRYPKPGLEVCVAHGAKTKAAVAKAERVVAERRFQASLEAEGYRQIPPEELPEVGLDVISRAVAWMEYFSEQVELLRGDYRYTGSGAGAEQLRSEVQVFERAMDRVQKFVTEWARLGLDERRVRVSEIQAGRVSDFAKAWARANGLDPESPEQLEILDRVLPILDGAPVPALTVGEG